MKTTKAFKESGPFKEFEPRALDFFTEFEAHPTRDWFLAHKGRYERLIRDAPARAQSVPEALTDCF